MPGQVCSDGVCETRCNAGLVDCNGACIDPLTDTSFCGASDACDGSTAGDDCNDDEVCSGGSCQTNCTGGTVLCDGRCADPKYDPNYCGATADCAGESAGQICGDDEVCDEGACRSECGPDNIVCNGSCVDPMVNPNFCGASDTCADAQAGVVCGAGEACVEGSCAPNCPEGQLNCNGRCIDPMTNPNFCGASDTCTDDAAGVACGGSQACLGGTCFQADVVFISPFDREGDSVSPRPMTYTVDTTVPNATIHYTVDGTDPVPGQGSTTTTTDEFQIGPLGDANQLRYVVEVDGRLSSPEMLRAAIQPTNERGNIIENLDINDQGPVATVAPGAQLYISGGVQYWRQNADGYCPGCFVQTNISMQSFGRILCLEATSTYPGRFDNINRLFNAPLSPGDYLISVNSPLAFSCSGVSTGFSGGAVIGVVQVRAPIRTEGGL